MKVVSSQNLKSICAVMLLGLMFSSCESRFNEKSPDGIASANIELNERVAANTTLDAKLDLVQASATKLKNVISLFRKFDKSADQSYTPVDLALDLTQELKNGLPHGGSGHYTKEAHLILTKIPNLTSGCEKIDATFETLDPSLKNDGDTLVLEQAGVLSLRTCYSQGYVRAFEVHTTGASISLVMLPDAFRKLFSGLIPDVLGKLTSSCNFGNDKQGMITQINCSNLGMNLNKIENLMIDSLSYDLNSDTRFEVTGTVYNQVSVVVRPVHIKIGANGVEFSEGLIDASAGTDWIRSLNSQK